MNGLEYARCVGGIKLSDIELRPNYFEFDPVIYGQANDIRINLEQHYHDIGIELGLICHRRQILNYYPTVEFHVGEDGRIKVVKDGEEYDIADFCQRFLYNKSLQELVELSILDCVEESTLLSLEGGREHRMMVLFQIGENYEVAMEMMCDLPELERYGIVFTYHVDMPSDILEYIRARYGYRMLIRTTVQGSDISSAWIAYCRTMDISYQYILKLHTKVSTEWRNHMMEPFRQDMDSKIEMFGRNDQLGMIGALRCLRIREQFPFCRKTLNELYGQRYVPFIAGTIFMSRRDVWDSIWMKCGRVIWNSLILPFYYVNTVFLLNSPVHTLERIYGGETMDMGLQMKVL